MEIVLCNDPSGLPPAFYEDLADSIGRAISPNMMKALVRHPRSTTIKFTYKIADIANAIRSVISLKTEYQTSDMDPFFYLIDHNVFYIRYKKDISEEKSEFLKAFQARLKVYEILFDPNQPLIFRVKKPGNTL
jgi:hypothetical protein